MVVYFGFFVLSWFLWNINRKLSRRLLPLGWMFPWQWRRILKQIRLLVGCLKCKLSLTNSIFCWYLGWPCRGSWTDIYSQTYFKYRYAYAVASAWHGVGNILYKDFMIQVRWDYHSFYWAYNVEYINLES